MTEYLPVDLGEVQRISLEGRQNKVQVERFASRPEAGRSFVEFLAALPDIDAKLDFDAVVEAIVKARRNDRPVIWGMGAHVVKCGLNPVLIELLRRRVITAVALNGAGAVHDFELALIGETSEDVAAGLAQGTFGMVRETADGINSAISGVASDKDRGMGALIGKYLLDVGAPNVEHSLLAAAYEVGVPITIHVAIGTDICHMHPTADGAAIGQATFNDFRLLCSVVRDMSGGVYINAGSSVILPEVFLKAFTVAQNLGANLSDFVTANLDMIAHYRPGQNVVGRPPKVGGRGYHLAGRHEFMVPLLAHAVLERLE